MGDMGFDPLDSGHDEDDDYMLTGKKTKDASRKKSKGSQLIRIGTDKKEKRAIYNDSHSPNVMKHKKEHNVIGVVGPADYIDEHGSPPPDPSPLSQARPAMSPSNANTPPPAQIGGQQMGNQRRLQQTPHQLPSNLTQPVVVPIANFNKVAPKAFSALQPQPGAQFQQNLFPMHPQSVPNPAERQRPTANPGLVSNLDRPQPVAQPQGQFHSNDINSSQRQQSLLTQAMSSPQVHSQLAQQPMQHQQQHLVNQQQLQYQQQQAIQQQQQQQLQRPGTPSSHMRNKSYSRAMSEPLVVQPDISAQDIPFESNFTETPSTAYPSGASPRDPAYSPPVSPSVAIPAEDYFSHSPMQNSNRLPLPSNNVLNSSIDSEDGGWASFSGEVFQDGDGIDDQEFDGSPRLMKRRVSRGGESNCESINESIPESTSSLESEEDSVWKINDEQREYYTNQFLTLQPNEGGVIKGPQARDFFIKSTLPTETLSKIWHLSDLNKDRALNLDEFCIAMHLVVAVRHGVELPATLPPTLLPMEEVDPFDVPLATPTKNERSADETVEEKPQSPKQWADFDASAQALQSRGMVQTHAQSSHSMTTPSSEIRMQPVSSHPVDDQTVNTGGLPPVKSQKFAGNLPGPPGSNLPQTVNNVIDQSNMNQNTQDAPLKGHAVVSQKNSAIARPRASGATPLNLMDASPYQLLPPPPPTSKAAVKKSLLGKSDSNPIQQGVSSQSTEKLVEIQHSDMRSESPEKGVKPLTSDSEESDTDSRTDHMTDYQRTANKITMEKSHSIESLASVKSMEFQRTSSKRGNRPRSVSGDSIHSVHLEGGRDFAHPPVPPPRPAGKGHGRTASLDMNQLFHAQTQSLTALDKPKPKEIALESPSSKSMITLPPPPKSSDGDLRSALLKRGTRGSVPENMSDSSLERSNEVVKVTFKQEVEHFGKTKSNRPIERKMRKHELQAGIRLLREKNSTLHSVNSDLDQEWKEIIESRASLENQVLKSKQQNL